MLPRTYDHIFRRHAGRLPVNYMRALSKRESDLNPREAKDPAWGLMQVVPVVRFEYNKKHGTNYSKSDLLKPEVNVKIASNLINRIVKLYGSTHPNTPNMRENWNNPEFVKLVTAGWNSGYSNVGGVGKVARYLERQGIPVTHDNVFRYSQAAGATRHLTGNTSLRWQRSVADLFYAEGGPESMLGSVGVRLAIVAGGAYLLYRYM